jgi:predicted transcriptional regulator
VIWSLGRASVREVHAEFSKTRPVAYTTMMTMMNMRRVDIGAVHHAAPHVSLGCRLKEGSSLC